MEQIKKKRISTKDKLMEETINNLIETEDEIFADEEGMIIDEGEKMIVIEGEMYNEIIEGIIYNMPSIAKRSAILINTKEDITNVGLKKVNEREVMLYISTDGE